MEISRFITRRDNKDHDDFTYNFTFTNFIREFRNLLDQEFGVMKSIYQPETKLEEERNKHKHVYTNFEYRKNVTEEEDCIFDKARSDYRMYRIKVINDMRAGKIDGTTANELKHEFYNNEIKEIYETRIKQSDDFTEDIHLIYEAILRYIIDFNKTNTDKGFENDFINYTEFFDEFYKLLNHERDYSLENFYQFKEYDKKDIYNSSSIYYRNVNVTDPVVFLPMVNYPEYYFDPDPYICDTTIEIRAHIQRGYKLSQFQSVNIQCQCLQPDLMWDDSQQWHGNPSWIWQTMLVVGYGVGKRNIKKIYDHVLKVLMYRTKMEVYEQRTDEETDNYIDRYENPKFFIILELSTKVIEERTYPKEVIKCGPSNAKRIS